jgi:NADPH:quinone reductase-like Zn-dependent oxidoreductase
MKAIVHDRYGSPEVLRLDEVAKPVAGDNEVLVRVRAAAVNARDWHAMRGDPYLARLSFGLRGPRTRIRGTDFAGQVEAVGRHVTRFRPGDQVFGEVPAAFAEYLTVPDDLVEPSPATLSFEQAAALPLAGNTALMGLRDVARTRPGQRVLINGASGGVGTFAVQLAKSYGAHVTGVCSARNIELVRSLGADEIVDYASADFTRGAEPYDVVFDLVGNRSLADLRRALTPTGTLVLSGGGVSEGGSLVGPIGLVARGQLLSRFVRHRVVTLTATPSGKNLATLREFAESGTLTPIIDRTLPLSETAEAIRYVEQEHARAKVVLTVAAERTG